MTNKPKEKGTAYESMTRAYLRRRLPYMDIDRSPLHSSADVGDILGVFLPMPHKGKVPMVIECKNVRDPRLRVYLGQTRKEIRDMGAGAVGVLTYKLPGVGPKHMDLQPTILFDEEEFVLTGRKVLPLGAVKLRRGALAQLEQLSSLSLKRGCACAWRYQHQPRTAGRLLVVSLGVLCDIIGERHRRYWEPHVGF